MHIRNKYKIRNFFNCKALYGVLLPAFILLLAACEKVPVDKFADIDGNTYDTIRIGNQVWMKENLRTSRLNDGTPLALTPYSVEWGLLQKPGYCWYVNHEAFFSLNKYGALYNGYAVQTGKLCPAGWHVPTNADWNELSAYIGWDAGGGKLREAGTENWAEPNQGATNETGFTALPGGYRDAYYKDYKSFRYTAYFWSSDNSGSFSLSYGDSRVSGRPSRSVKDGVSVRCVKNR